MLDYLIPYAKDLGATAVIFALLIYSWNQSRQQHQRSMARDVKNAELLDSLVSNLLDCMKTFQQELNK